MEHAGNFNKHSSKSSEDLILFQFKIWGTALERSGKNSHLAGKAVVFCGATLSGENSLEVPHASAQHLPSGLMLKKP